MKLALAVGTLLAMLIFAIAGSYWLSLTAIQRSQHQWCSTLVLITANAHPTNPNGVQFYRKLHELEHQFGCE